MHGTTNLKFSNPIVGNLHMSAKSQCYSIRSFVRNSEDVVNKSLKSYSRITVPCLNLVLTGSLVGDGSGEASMMTQRSACWSVSWCHITWTTRSSWRHAARHRLVATAPVYLADHKILASPWPRSNTCWVRQLPLLVSVSRRCRDPSGVTWFSSAQILTLLSKFS